MVSGRCSSEIIHEGTGGNIVNMVYPMCAEIFEVLAIAVRVRFFALDNDSRWLVGKYIYVKSAG